MIEDVLAPDARKRRAVPPDAYLTMMTVLSSGPGSTPQLG